MLSQQVGVNDNCQPTKGSNRFCFVPVEQNIEIDNTKKKLLSQQQQQKPTINNDDAMRH